MSEKAWWASASVLAAVLEVSNSDTAAQAVMTAIADGLRAEFVSFCGRQILAPETGTITEYHDGGRETLRLNVSPVTSVTSVWADTTRAFAAASLVESSLYVLLDHCIYFNVAPSKGSRVVKVEYVGGYAALPDDIERVFHAELRKEWALRKTPGIQSMGVQGANFTVSQRFGLMSETQRVLTNYKASCLFF